MSEAKWFRLVGVEIGNATTLYPNGDNIQTVEVWMPPELFADISVPAIHKILNDISTGLPDGKEIPSPPSTPTESPSTENHEIRRRGCCTARQYHNSCSSR